jgi:hypothetical protein
MIVRPEQKNGKSVGLNPPSTNGQIAHERLTPRLTGKARGECERAILAQGIKGTARLVLIELFGFFRGKAICWPGNAALAKAAGVCPRTVSTALKALEAAGVILTVDDSSVRSRRQILLLAHPSAAVEKARLEASPHTKFQRCRIGKPASDTSQRRLQDMQPGPCTPCNPEVANFATESRYRSSARPEPPNSDGGTGGENSSQNGNGRPLAPLAREPREKPDTQASPEAKICTHPSTAATPLTEWEQQIKRMADEGDKAAAVEWHQIMASKMRQADEQAAQQFSPWQIVSEVLGKINSQTPGVEYLAKCKPGAPEYVWDQAVEVLCHEFGKTDQNDSRHAYQGIIRRVRTGKLSVDVLTYAYRQACLPSADYPGRVFIHNVERHQRPPIAGPDVQAGKAVTS